MTPVRAPEAHGVGVGERSRPSFTSRTACSTTAAPRSWTSAHTAATTLLYALLRGAARVIMLECEAKNVADATELVRENDLGRVVRLVPKAAWSAPGTIALQVRRVVGALGRRAG